MSTQSFFLIIRSFFKDVNIDDVAQLSQFLFSYHLLMKVVLFYRLQRNLKREKIQLSFNTNLKKSDCLSKQPDFYISNFSKNLPADCFSFSFQAAQSPEKDLVRQNLGKP